ncbi:MAG TPA: oligogalacturonate lyase family protein [Bryobacteraceae bacterium]|nr:oligogalacturonate lyase family protein [Bryobacteraceae bacterium]HPT27905.1 oligogalacturonate lyase family protein [Bryobacteraceae bacterium]
MQRRTICTVLLAGFSLWGAQTYKDPKSGLEIVEIEPPGAGTTNLYFHFPNFTAGDANIIFAATVEGTSQIFRYDMATGKAGQVTTGPGVGAAGACPHPRDARLVYYPRGQAIEEIDITTGKVRRIGALPAPTIGGPGQPTFSHDLKSLALVRQRDESNWEVGLMDLATGAWRAAATVGFRVGHVQHHPSEPMIFYVWETGGYAPQRTWVVNDDGTANRPFYYTTDPKQWVTPLKEWVTHESWVPATGGMTLIMDKIGIVVADKNGKGRILPGNYWHARARDDGQFLVADDFDGNLWLIETATDNRRLLASGLRQTVPAVHAHASFDHSGRYVLFNTGRSRQTIAYIDLVKAGLATLP